MYTQQAHAISVPFTLGWNSNNETDIKGYHIYFGTSPEDEDFLSPVVVWHSYQTTIHYTINEYISLANGEKYRLVEGRTYWIALSAYDIYHNESAKTEPIPVYIEQITITTSTTTSLTPDATPPMGTVTINQGNDTTASQVVTLNLSAEANESGMGEGTQMSFSNDNKNWSGPEAFLSTKEWILTPGEGEKTVYAQFCDEAGNWMDEPVSDSIELIFSCPKPLQLDATVLESSGTALPACSADKTLDGKSNSGWLSPLRRAMQDEYITIDLGEKKLINQIDICSNPFLWLTLFPHDFSMQVSTDTETWEELFPAVENYSPPSSYSDSWAFDETEARYIKMVATKSRSFLLFFYLTYISEIKVSGCAAPEVISPQLISKSSFDETEMSVAQQIRGMEIPDQQKPLSQNVPPGRPGKPVFILPGSP